MDKNFRICVRFMLRRNKKHPAFCFESLDMGNIFPIISNQKISSPTLQEYLIFIRFRTF